VTVREQTLEEWFSDYQLRALMRDHAFVPIDLEVDVTRVVRAYEAEGGRAPLLAIVIKAAALLAWRHPEVNRAVLRTPLGTRVVQFEEAHVNVPVRVTHAGKEHVSATVVRGAHRLSVAEIVEHLQSARRRPIDELPIARRFARGTNTLADRLALRARHFCAYSVPAFYERYGGGISVSSVLRPAPAGVVARIPSLGPTAFTFCPGPVRDDGRRVSFHIGLGYDHAALPGLDALRCADAFGALLVEGAQALFGPPLRMQPAGAHAPSPHL
jgi:hypothetical protein